MPYRYAKRGGGSQFFYVSNSGYEQKTIFRTSEDANYFTSKLALFAETYSSDIKVIAYFLSHDSFHIVVQEQTQGSVAKILHKLSVSYAMYFNNKYEDSGKLFRGPYKEEQLPSINAAIVKAIYIQKMPMQHMLLPADYKWSSLRGIIDGTNKQWIDYNLYLSFFKTDQQQLPKVINDFMDATSL